MPLLPVLLHDQCRGLCRFYRKHFTLPLLWKGSAVWLRFEGVWRNSRAWLNGIPVRDHAGFGDGYTSFNIRLDNVTSLKFGAGAANENVLAMYVDARLGSGWW